MSLAEIATPADISRIAAQNDALRTTFTGGVVSITCGIQGLKPEVKAEVLRRVRTFDRFTKDNDPYGERDYGSFDIAGQVFVWKIDAYDKRLEHGSPDP